MNYAVRRGFTSKELKIIAIVTMLIDHVGAVLIENTPLYQSENWTVLDVLLRLTGRIAFPLFCFLLVEGFMHTSNVKKYILYMGAFAVISELPFDLALFGKFNLYGQNVFFTLFIGLVMLQVLHTIATKIEAPLWRTILPFLVTLLACASSIFLLTDYSYLGVLLIAILYFFRNDRKKQCIIGGILFLFEVTSIFAFMLIYRYNGQKGEGKMPKLFFYWFYPLHLLALWSIQYMICGF